MTFDMGIDEGVAVSVDASGDVCPAEFFRAVEGVLYSNSELRYSQVISAYNLDLLRPSAINNRSTSVLGECI